MNCTWKHRFAIFVDRNAKHMNSMNWVCCHCWMWNRPKRITLKRNVSDIFFCALLPVRPNHESACVEMSSQKTVLCILLCTLQSLDLLTRYEINFWKSLGESIAFTSVSQKQTWFSPPKTTKTANWSGGSSVKTAVSAITHTGLSWLQYRRRRHVWPSGKQNVLQSLNRFGIQWSLSFQRPACQVS